MPDGRYDESRFAERAAAIVGSEHATLDVDPRPGDELPNLVRTLGLPFGDSSLLPTYWVSRETRAHVGVALTGDGGDEMFCGYERHVVDRWLRRHRRLLAAIPRGLVPETGPRSRVGKVRRLVGAARAGGYPDLVALFPREDLHALLGGIEPTAASMDPRPEGFWFDRGTYLPEDLLRKTDTASMAVALEARAPILGAELMDACYPATEAELMPRGQRKGLLRAVARKYFPPEIVDRPKMGFAIPIGEWFRSDYGGMRRLLLDHLRGPEPFGPDRLGINHMINMAFVEQMIREHDAAGEKSIWPWKGRDHSQRLYMLLVLSIWAKWLGGLQRGGGAGC
jgi:asparagine synthase (glutamine-hydrolysing)